MRISARRSVWHKLARRTLAAGTTSVAATVEEANTVPPQRKAPSY